MHEMNYVHLDLKPENIMFTTKKSNQLKLIDFGLTAHLDPRQSVKVSKQFKSIVCSDSSTSTIKF